MTADPQTFRKAWGKFATGVSVVTTIQPDGHVHGMTASDINSVSLEPLLVLVCMGHNRNSYPLIKESRRFCINILSENQQAVALNYAKPPGDRNPDFEKAISFTESGSAKIDGSLAYMDCRVVKEMEAGDHTIFVGEVDEIQVNESVAPLIYYNGGFGRLESNET